MIALKSLIFTVLVPGTVTVLVPYFILSVFGQCFALDPGGFKYLGLILLLIGVSIYFHCVWDFSFTGKGTPAPIAPPQEMVITGLYRFVRNPMYLGVVLILIGESVFFGSGLLLAYSSLVFLIFHLFVVVYEEPTLRRLFGESYLQYYHTVPRWLPRWQRPGPRG
jgi:protein-S-isoprenylcysteine O-methyltransferase Ste14